MPDDLQRAEALLDLGRAEEARSMAARLLATSPEDAGLHAVLAQASLHLDDYPGALAAANRVVALEPESEWGHRICALVLATMKQYDEAIRAAHEAIRRAPNSWRTHHALALVAAESPGQLRRAEQAADLAVSLGPEQPETHFARGLVAQRQRRDDIARDAYRRVLALDPSHAIAVHNLTMIDGGRSLGRTARGLGSALRLDPQESALLESVDLLAVRFIRRLYWAGLLGLVVGLGASLADGGLEEARVTPVSATVGVLVLAVVFGYTWMLTRSIPAGMRVYVRGRLRSDAFLLCNSGLTLLMLLTALVACLVPHGAEVGLIALRPIGLLNVALFVWSSRRNVL